MKLLQLTLVSMVAAVLLFIAKPAYAVYTQTVIATGGQSFSGAQISFTTSTGEKGQIQRDPNDNRKIMIVLPDGAQGGSGTLTVTRGGKTSNIAISLAGGPVMINTSTGMARAGKPRISNRYDISVGLFGTIGQALGNGRVDFGGMNSERMLDDFNLLKFGVGAAARVGFPRDWPLWYPMFMDLSFTSYPGQQKDRKRGNQDSYINWEENWRAAMMFGVTPWEWQAMKLSVMAGFSVIQQDIRLDFGNSRREGRSRYHVVPSFGAEVAMPLSTFANVANITHLLLTGEPIWFMGVTLDILKETRVNGNGATATIDGNLQYQFFAGLRFPL